MDEFGFPHGGHYSRCRVGAKEQTDSKQKVLASQWCFRLHAVFQEVYMLPSSTVWIQSLDSVDGFSVSLLWYFVKRISSNCMR